MELSNEKIDEMLAIIKTLEISKLSEMQTYAITKLKLIVKPIDKTYYSCDNNLNIGTIEKVLGINCSNLYNKRYDGMIKFWNIPNGNTFVDTWLNESLNKTDMMNMKSGAHMIVNLIIINVLKDFNELNFEVNITRQYSNKLNEALITLISKNNSEISGYTGKFVLEIKNIGFTEEYEKELIVKMGIIYAKEKICVYGAIANKDQWKFYKIDSDGIMYKTKMVEFENGDITRVLFILNYIMKSIYKIEVEIKETIVLSYGR